LVGWAALGHELGPNGVYHFLVCAAERKTMEDGRRTSLVSRPSVSAVPAALAGI